MTQTANALPTKRFFIDNIVRDITLEDAILDLADNSIDSLVRVFNLDVSPSLLGTKEFVPPRSFPNSIEQIQIQIDDEQFSISDVCGGIDIDHARENVFRFGRPEGQPDTTLGVYGIGLKRAVFKIGREFTIESHTSENGFRVTVDVDEWAADDTSWEFPLESLESASSLSEAGTTITISRLNEEVLLRLSSGGFRKGLADEIARTYTLFLERFLTVSLNGKNIEPSPLPIAASDELVPGHKTHQWDEVQLDLYAGLASREDGEWISERAGWYVLCNGRVVVSADKTRLTGWGALGASFVSKYRGFIGIAFFFSGDPTSLPWTTTKRGINTESRVYQLARKEMALLARPVLTFLNNMYPSDAVEQVVERKLTEDLQKATIEEITETSLEAFKSPDTSQLRKKRKTVSIQFEVDRSDVDRIKKHLGKSRWSARQVGRYIFDYFIRMEIPE